MNIHQEAHNELLDLEEPVPETKKVTDFLKGIQAFELSVGKSAFGFRGVPTILGDPDPEYNCSSES